MMTPLNATLLVGGPRGRGVNKGGGVATTSKASKDLTEEQRNENR